MTLISKAQKESELSWYRINLTKRKELEPFRKTIIHCIDEINEAEDTACCDDDIVFVDFEKRLHLFPSNVENVDGYYSQIMDSIRYSGWVKCTETELTAILEELNGSGISSDAARKSNSGVIRKTDASEIKTLKWIIENAPRNLYRSNSVPTNATLAMLPVPGDVELEGRLRKMRGKVENDKFYFSVLDLDLFMIIAKDTAEEVCDISKLIDAAKHNKEDERKNKRVQWMVIRAVRGYETRIVENLERWKESSGSDVSFETFLPICMKEVTRNNKVSRRKALMCPGYVFIRTSISDLTKIETDKKWDGQRMYCFLLRQTKSIDSNVLTISEREMIDFKFAVNCNLSNVSLDDEDFIDNELVKYHNPDSVFNDRVGRVAHKKDGLYLSFLPFGGVFNKIAAIKIESGHICKLSAVELAEIENKG